MIKAEFRGPETKSCDECGTVFYRDKRCTWAHWSKARFCSRACSTVVGARVSRLNNTLSEQFERFVIRQDGCWGWRGAVNTAKGGYAIMPWNGGNLYGHLVSLELDGRKPPKGMYGCHHCDNPVCTNPEHLYVGTPKDNSRDARERGRLVRGEKVHFAKLNEQLVFSIRVSEAPIKDWADLLGVSRATIALVRRGETWRHVNA